MRDIKIFSKNLELFGKTFLDWYNKVAISDHMDELEELTQLGAHIPNFYPLYKAEIGRDIRFVAFCSDYTTRIFVMKARDIKDPVVVILRLDDHHFDNNWSLYQNPDKKKSEILQTIDESDGDIIYDIDYVSSGFLNNCSDEQIVRAAKSAAISNCTYIGGLILSELQLEKEKKDIIESFVKRYIELVEPVVIDKGVRGRLFQQLITDKFEREGAKPKNVRSISDEVDQIIVIAGQYYIAENRFTDDKVGAPDVRDFLHKLSSRPPIVIGVFISMAGFTSDAIHEINTSQNQRAIVFLERKDIDSIFLENMILVNIIQDKVRHLVEHRQAS